ncbi:MAG: hypothetical protein AB4041_05700 [Microcystaceae cyanobacterium]
MDKEDLLSRLVKNYDERIAFYEQMIQDKNDQISKLEAQITYLETLITRREQVIQVYNSQYNYQTIGDSTMTNEPTNPNITISGGTFSGGFAGRDYTGSVTNIINQIPDSEGNDNSELKALLQQLIEAINSESELDEDEKAEAATQVEKIAKASQKPDDEGLQKKATRAVKLLETTAKGLEPASKLVKACQSVLPKIITLLGFVI